MKCFTLRSDALSPPLPSWSDAPVRLTMQHHRRSSSLYDEHERGFASSSSRRVTELPPPLPSAGGSTTSPFHFPALNNATTRFSLQLCFCGAPADTEEDSIYCSTACGRADALASLECGRDELPPSSSSESLASDLSSRGSRDVSAARGGSAGSHYRRLEVAEAKKEADRARSEGREANVGVWRYQKSKGVKKATSSSSSASRLPSPPLPSTTTFLPPTRIDSLRSQPMARGTTHAPSTSTSTTGSSAPSLSSTGSYTSRHSYSSSLDSSIYEASPFSSGYPLSNVSTPIMIPKFQYDDHETLYDAPSTPPNHFDIYASYLDKSPTPTIVSKQQEHHYPDFINAMFSGSCSLDDGDGDEGRDVVEYSTGREGGWGGEKLKERVRERNEVAGRRTHQKAKLSFDDVVKLMQA